MFEANSVPVHVCLLPSIASASSQFKVLPRLTARVSDNFSTPTYHPGSCSVRLWFYRGQIRVLFSDSTVACPKPRKQLNLLPGMIPSQIPNHNPASCLTPSPA